MMDLTQATTKELADELARRDGTTSLYFGKGEEITINKRVLESTVGPSHSGGEGLMKTEVDCETDPFCEYYPQCKEIMKSLPEIQDMWFRHYIWGLILDVWENHHPDAACCSGVD